MSGHIDAVRRAAAVLDVPGTPKSLRLDEVEEETDAIRVRWSFLDPNRFPGDPTPPVRRIRGETVSPLGPDPEVVGGSCWGAAQLAAARSYKSQVDADFLPGEPYEPRVWTVDEAWQALLGYLSVGDATVVEDDGTVTVTSRWGTTTYRIDPAEWTDYLNPTGAPDDSEIVPAAHPMVRGLPLWVDDELGEAVGAWGPAIGLVDGDLVGLDPDDPTGQTVRG